MTTDNEAREQAWYAESAKPGAKMQSSFFAGWDAALASRPAVPAATGELIAELRRTQGYSESELRFMCRKAADALESLSQTPEEQWEWGVLTRDDEYVPVGDENWARDNAQRFGGSVVRRRPAGEWLPVEGEN